MAFAFVPDLTPRRRLLLLFVTDYDGKALLSLPVGNTAAGLLFNCRCEKQRQWFL